MAGSDPVLVVDADAVSRRHLVGLLERIGLETLPAGSGEEALTTLDGARPALALVDVDLPAMSGFELCRELQDAYGDSTRVIFLSARRTGSTDRVAGLLLGADDYVVKPFADDELLARVRRSLRRPERRRGGRLAAVADSAATGTLSPRELEVLTLLAEGLGQAQISSRLVISPKTVATHIKHVLAKLEVHSRAQAVAVAHRRGLLASR